MIAAMPKDRPRHLHREVSRHGLVTWYVRVDKGPRTRIKEPYGTKAFFAAYDAAVRGAPQPAPGKAHKGTLRWLVDEWKTNSDWHQTKPATKRQRENILLHVLETAGAENIQNITATAIEKGRERRMKTPAAANNYLKTMRALFRWAKKSRHVTVNPTLEVEFLDDSTDGFPPWSGDDVRKFCARWPEGSREHLALMLLIFTGLRRGDVVRVGRQHVRNGAITLRLEKTGREVTIPLLPPLAAAIEVGPVGDMTFIAGPKGRPRGKEHFGNWFRSACRAAGIDKSAHGIRKLSARLVAEGGGSEEDLMAWFGWSSIGMSQVYTRAANKAKLARRAGGMLMQGAIGDGSIPAPVLGIPAPKKSDGENNDLQAAIGALVGGEMDPPSSKIKKLRKGAGK